MHQGVDIYVTQGKKIDPVRKHFPTLCWKVIRHYGVVDGECHTTRNADLQTISVSSCGCVCYAVLVFAFTMCYFGMILA